MIIQIAKREKLWILLNDAKRSSSKSNVIEDSELDDKRKRLLYIMTMSIKSGVLKNLTTFKDLQQLWSTLKSTFEITFDNRRFELRNWLAQIMINDSKSFEQYFVKIQDIIAKLATTGVIVFDDDLVQIVMKAVSDSYNHFMEY